MYAMQSYINSTVLKHKHEQGHISMFIALLNILQPEGNLVFKSRSNWLSLNFGSPKNHGSNIS